MSDHHEMLLVGEIFVDFTLPTSNVDSKLRLGGIVHAARGLWAIDMQFAVAAVCPSYLVDQAREYLERLGCDEFIWLAEVKGSPNVIAIGDPTELADQAYQDILRNEKTVEFRHQAADLKKFKHCLVFPGKYDLTALANMVADDSQISFDIAYDLPSIEALADFKGKIGVLITSTSSELFLEKAAVGETILLHELRSFSPVAVLVKENRGGSQVFDLLNDDVEAIPALLGETVNSVGVGDAYSAVFVSLLGSGIFDAAWKAGRVATCYAQTTYPDDFKRDVTRSFLLSVDQMRELGGTILPWHARQDFQIYFAAPDFSDFDRSYLDQALTALHYHNFKVRRPVQENGELKKNSALSEMQVMYRRDVNLLEECDLVFALPQERDPGSLVELGLAIAMKIPVITFDPLGENANTMVMAGSAVYSKDLDPCLNGVFDALSKQRKNQ